MKTLAAGAALLIGCTDSLRPCIDGGRCEEPGCPTAMPSQGTSCALPASEACSYSGSGCAQPNTAICNATTRMWEITFAECPMQTRVCPNGIPVHDAPCDPASTLEHCSYGDCYGSPTTDATCNASTSRWQVLTNTCNPPPPICPDTAPTNGSSCAGPTNQPLQRCEYEVSSACPGADVQAVCDPDARTWQVTEISCPPPMPGNCPATAPAQESFCTATGTRCGYPTGSGCSEVFACDSVHGWVRIASNCVDGGVTDASVPDGG